MAVLEFFRKLHNGVSKKENKGIFKVSELYFLDDQDEHEELEVGETYVSVTGRLLDLVK